MTQESDATEVVCERAGSRETTPRSTWLRRLLSRGGTLLLLGLVTGAVAVFRMYADGWADESQSNASPTGLGELLAERFEHWELTPAQRDVAGYVVNGYSIKEIASFRDTSEGTVKA